MRIVLASNNAHKLAEIRAILATKAEVVSLHDIGFENDIEETGATLEANSLLKAQVVWDWMQGHPEIQADGVLSDDTGLEIEALGGQPGVYTARWAGEPANDVRNREKALALLQGESHRDARFRTVLTWIYKGKSQQYEGVVKGSIAEQESGEGGFGYDPIFVPEGYEVPFACLSAETKNQISHRALAIKAFASIL